MNNIFSTSAPLTVTEFDAQGNFKSPLEYTDPLPEEVQQLRKELQANTDRINNITDSIIQLFARIK